jgi:hypothetical protein
VFLVSSVHSLQIGLGSSSESEYAFIDHTFELASSIPPEKPHGRFAAADL